MGGGAHKNSLDSTLKNLNKSKRFFTPLIAGSLALALSASIANADSCTPNYPYICYVVDSNSSIVNTSTRLNNLSFKQDSDYYVPQWSSSDVSKVHFIFDNSASNSPDLSASPAGDTLTLTGKTNGKRADFSMRTGVENPLERILLWILALEAILAHSH